MIRYLWREALLNLLLLCTAAATFVFILNIILKPQETLGSLPIAISIIVVGIFIFIYFRKLSLSNNEFIEILKKNGFVVEYKFSRFFALRDDGELLYAYFLSRYQPAYSEFFKCTGTGAINLQFYFPCHANIEFNHYILKFGNKINFGHSVHPFQDSSKIKNTDADLKNIISEKCADIDCLIINHLKTKNGIIKISTGPESLAYGEYTKKNILGVLKFIQALRNYYGCQGEKWNRHIDMNNIKENIEVLNKEFMYY